MPPYPFLHQGRTPIAITYITSVLYERTKGCTERTDGVGSVEREISLTGPNAFPQLLSHGETGLVGRLQAVGISTAYLATRWPRARMTVTGAMDSARPNSQIYNGGLGCLRNSCSNTIRLDRTTASKLFGLTVNFEGIGGGSIGVPVPRCRADAFTLESYVTDRWTENATNIVFFDNVVIAKSYIGPAAEPVDTTAATRAAKPDDETKTPQGLKLERRKRKMVISHHRY